MFYREQSDAMECTYAVNCTDCAAIVVGLANMMGEIYAVNVWEIIFY